MTLLAMSYPFMVHAAVARNDPALTVAALTILATLLITPGLLAKNLYAWIAAPVCIGIIVLLAKTADAGLPLYAPPVLLNFFAAWIFGRTLVKGQVPLIERLVRLLHDPQEQLDPAIPPYARRLTLAWAILLSGLGVINLLLALYAMPAGIIAALGYDPPVQVPREIWSLFANFLNYLIVAGFFIAEYIYRRRRFPQQPYRNFLDFIRRAAAVGHRAVRSRTP